MNRLLILTCAALAGCLPQGRAADTRPDEPAFRVVLPDSPKEWEKTAATELEHCSSVTGRIAKSALRSHRLNSSPSIHAAGKSWQWDKLAEPPH